jgi:hypothetical protein
LEKVEKGGQTTRSKEDEDKHWIDKIEETLKKLNQEEEARKRAQQIHEERRKALLEERKLRQEELLRKEHEKRDKKVKQNMLQKRWDMMKWVSKYLDENTDRWKIEKEQRETETQLRLQDWAKLSRFEKIKHLKHELEIKTSKLTIKLKPPLFNPPPQHKPPTNTVTDQAEQQPTTPIMQAKDDQVEHCPPQRIDAQPTVHEGRAEHCTTATLAATVDARGRAEQQSTSSSSPDNTHHTRQSHTTKWAVDRYVHSPIKACNEPILTPPHCPGTYAAETQAEQQHRE